MGKLVALNTNNEEKKLKTEQPIATTVAQGKRGKLMQTGSASAPVSSPPTVYRTSPVKTTPVTQQNVVTPKRQSKLGKVTFSGNRTPGKQQKYSVGKGIAGATMKGINKAAQGIADTLALAEDVALSPFELVSGQQLGDLSDSGLANKLQRRIRNEGQEIEDKYAANVERGGKAAEIFDKYGALTVAAAPQAVAAVLTSGASLGATPATLAKTAATEMAPSIANTIRNSVFAMGKDPQYWLSFSQVVGSSYEQALDDMEKAGVDNNTARTKAALYATGNGLMNAAVEVGGGIQTLPEQLKHGSAAWKAWLESAFEEGKEEVVQGILERATQNVAYKKGNPLASMSDENAILNPRTSAEEFLGGAVVGGVLGGGQVGANAALQSLARFDNSLGESGRKAIRGSYQEGKDTAEHVKDFIPAYNAGVEGKANPNPANETAYAGYVAGQNDAKKSAGTGEHIDSRTKENVSGRNVNAFQFDHPELHSYYSAAAEQIAGIADMSLSRGQQKGARQRTANGYQRSNQIFETPAMRKAMDEGLTRTQIIDAAQRIINDNGQENVKAAKTLEIVLDDMLTNGYTAVDGTAVAPNTDYIAAKQQIAGAEAQATGFDKYVTDNRLALETGEVTMDELRAEYAQQEGAEHGEAVHLRDGSERDNGANPRGEVRGVEESTGRDQSRKKGRHFADSEAAALDYGEKVSTASFGIGRGAVNDSVYLVKNETKEMRKAKDLAKERGLRVTFFAGNNLTFRSKNGKTFQARGYVSGDRVFIRADHPEFTSYQIMRHEAGHDMIAKGEVDLDEVRTRIDKTFTSGEVGSLCTAYADAYAGTEMTAQEIWEEVVCDSLGDMNIFADSEISDAAAFLLAHIKVESETVAQENSRAPPSGTGQVREKFSYAGEKAENADKAALNTAKEMEKNGADAETIRQKTGWFRGADGKWRWEIDDSGTETDTKWNFLRNPDAKRYNELFEKAYLYDTATAEDLNELQILDKNLKGVRKSPLYLDEIVRHDKLFEAYPALRDVKVRFEANTGNAEGAYHDGFNEIVLRAGLKLEPEKLKDTLIHEIQHAIQSTEGFSGGSSPEYWARRDYESGDMIETRLQKKKNSILRALGKDEVNKYARYNELERELGKLFLADENSEDGGKYNKLEAEQDAIYEELYPNEWFKSLLDIDRKMENPSEVYTDLYRNTAGEIEARDAAARRGLTAEERRGRKPDTGDENTVFSDSGESYEFVGKNKDGIEVYETDEDIKKMSYKERMEAFMDIMRNEYAGRTAKFSDGNNTYYAKFDEADLRKNVYGDKKSSQKGWKAKINTGADGSIFELVENATYNGGKPEQGKKAQAHQNLTGWEYFVKTVQIDGQVYDLLANVRKKPDGEFVYSIQLNENKNKASAPPLQYQNGTAKANNRPVGVSTNASNGSVPQNGGNVNKVNDAQFSREIPEANYEVLKEKYGYIPAGERAYREVQVPKKTADDKYVSRTIRTVLEAKATPDAMIPTLERMVAKGDFSYDRYTDKQAISDAESRIKTEGWQKTLNKWKNSTKEGISKENTAIGWALYNNAANSGDVETAIDVLDTIVKRQRNAAQALQATRLLKQQDPSTQLYAAQRSVENLTEDLKKQYGEKAPDLKIDRDLAEKFLNAKDDDARTEAMKEIYRDIGRQMPSRFIDKWNAWRYLSMLGNPRTHVRNIVGNVGFVPAVTVKNVIGAGIESAANAVSGGKVGRTKAILTTKDAGLIKAAWSDYANIREQALGSGKYNDNVNVRQEIEEGRTIFKPKLLEAMRKFNSTALDAEDAWFSKPHYAAALAQFCKANGITAEQVFGGKGIEAAREYAIREAQKATYRDTNAFSQMISDLGRYRGDNKMKRLGSTLAEGILPFRKTPANILVRGVEYSPIGFLKSISYDLVQVQKGNMQATEMIDRAAAGLTGTGLMMLGLYMAKEGILRGSGGDDEKKKKFDELQGHQEYALELPNGTSITLDWLAPEALPFFVGANLYEQMQANNGYLTMSDMLQAASNVTDPLLSMSCLQSLNDVFDAVGYASSGDTNALTSAVASAATSYLTQGIPTVFGQAERTGESTRMTTYTDKNKFLTPDMQYALGKASARIPGVDYGQIPFIDAWGRTENSGGVAARAFNNFANPAYTSKVSGSKMEDELSRLYEATGETKVLPQRAPKFFTVNKENKQLTGEEYVKYATKRGQTSYKIVSELTGLASYKSMSDGDKADAVAKAYEYANIVGKMSVSSYQPDGWVAKAVETVKKTGVSEAQYIVLYLAKGGIESLKDKNGDTISNSEGLQIMELVYQQKGLSDKQRAALFEDFGVGKSIRHWNRARVDEQLKIARRKAA
jgi:hypothetical protein|nr:MAG TPA: Large polyvalent protein associated domain 23 [Caudoviricetes sp.]